MDPDTGAWEQTRLRPPLSVAQRALSHFPGMSHCALVPSDGSVEPAGISVRSVCLQLSWSLGPCVLANAWPQR